MGLDVNQTSFFHVQCLTVISLSVRIGPFHLAEFAPFKVYFNWNVCILHETGHPDTAFQNKAFQVI